MNTIYFAGGCFWGTQHFLNQFEGVVHTEVGYANGSIANPTYQEVYTDQTGHVECVRVIYDSNIISLETLCRLFFKSIDPLLKNRQGNDCGTRYRTGIYWIEESDEDVVNKVFAEVQMKYNEPLVVEKAPLDCFYTGEEYHQQYLVKNPEGYCHLSPVLIHFAKIYTLIIKELRKYSDEQKKVVLPKFFKTGVGEYAQGDQFLGVVVPNTRKVAKQFKEIPFEVIEWLLESQWHEVRLCALLIIVERYKTSPEEAVRFYVAHTKHINNWDLVDLSAPYVLGNYLFGQEDHHILYQLAHSENMWEQRIAIVSTIALIRGGYFDETLKLAKMFLSTKHDLIQKAAGWMLREVGKRNEPVLTDFLTENKDKMPRTMLRYAIEKFPAEKRREFMR